MAIEGQFYSEMRGGNMKNDIVSFIGGGIKCDNPECDYMDETVRVEDYKE